ncbi:MAG: APC family permease [Actinomycetota bacterium]
MSISDTEVQSPPEQRASQPRVRARGSPVKRLLLGPALPTQNLKHERLGKPTALAVFASDNLSSVAYATEEILKVVVPIAGILAFGLLMPITIAILGVLAILLFSYRQTLKAYPRAGGAYIVTKDNFGLIPAQVAGAALLTDYVLTVSVSVAAGVAAITSAAPGLYTARVPLAVFFIWFIAWGNLRGVRESGRMFAVPTYLFIGMMFLLLAMGFIRAFGGDLHQLPLPADAVDAAGPITLFLILHAFASGGAAVTGVEAISDGVPAFRPPAWKNARATLMWMGCLLGTMFLGLSFLAFRLHAVPAEGRTVISEIGRAVFGGGSAGFALFLTLQIATTLILILAANTSFADFPRLANFQAGDAFLPRQLTKRGHRLVFSNGIIGLAVTATLLVVLFRADVHRLIPLYAIGVFTSFTLSQAGMAKRHLKIREPGWRRGTLINGLGAVTTAVVAVIVAITKFTHGAWAIMVFVPVLVVFLVRLNRRYAMERRELELGIDDFRLGPPGPQIALVLVDELDHKTMHALQYAKTIRAERIEAIHFEPGDSPDTALREQWNQHDLRIPLKVVKATSDTASCLAGYLAAMPEDSEVTVIVPGPARMGSIERLRRGRTGAKLARALLPNPRARITLVRDHGHDGIASADERDDSAHRPRPKHIAVVLVDRIDRAALQAVRYAVSIGAAETWGVHADVDPERQQEMITRWLDLVAPIPLVLLECWDRNIARSVETYVLELLQEDCEVTVVLPRRDYAELRQRILHDRTSRQLSRALARHPHVDVAVVPYFVPTPGAMNRADRIKAHETATGSLG